MIRGSSCEPETKNTGTGIRRAGGNGACASTSKLLGIKARKSFLIYRPNLIASFHHEKRRNNWGTLRVPEGSLQGYRVPSVPRKLLNYQIFVTPITQRSPVQIQSPQPKQSKQFTVVLGSGISIKPHSRKTSSADYLLAGTLVFCCFSSKVNL